MSPTTTVRTTKRKVRIGLAASVSAALLATLVQAPASADTHDRPWMNTALSAEERATLVVEAATLEEKMTIVSGSGSPARYDRDGVPRLNIPPIDGTDSAIGVQYTNVLGPGVTQFPSGLSLAATFDAALAEAQGAAVGREARELGFNEIFGPNLDLARVPWSGRLHEGYGEDTLLVGDMGSAKIRGIQSNGITSSAKHYLIQTQETDRFAINEEVSERAVREVFLPPWEKAVDDGLANVMCAFNRQLGEFACENEFLLNDVLKGDLGFEGYVISDFNAVKSTVESANAGLDVEGPVPFYWLDLPQAIEDGLVPMSRLDDMVYRIVRQYFKLGLIDNPSPGLFDNPTTVAPPQGPVAPATLAANAGLAKQIGEEGSVLLKNDGILPLDRSAGESIAVIGAGATQNMRGSAGVGKVASWTSILEGITDSADGPVEFAAGTEPIGTADMLGGPAPVAPSALSSNGAPGLTGEYFMGVGFNGAPLVTRQDPFVNYLSGLPNALGAGGASEANNLPPQFAFIGGPWSARWTGEMTAPATGTYTLSTSYQLSRARLVVDGQELISTPPGGANSVATATIDLQAGQTVSVLLEMVAAPQLFTGPVRPGIRLGWELPEGALSAEMDEAVEVAARNDVAVLVVRDYNTEAADRGDLNLPQDQDRLVRAVLAANPRTVIVAATGGPVLMPWRNDAPAILQAWYPGQAQGEVVASLLFGDVNPSGKLPLSFPTGEREHPLSTVEQWPGVGGTATHTEDGDFGYRGYAARGITPAYAFGHGLSYTDFTVSDLVLDQPAAFAGTAVKGQTAVTATFTVTNTGSRAGTTIPQVYVVNPNGGGAPVPVLKGYQRVELAAGESRSVSIELDQRAFSVWNSEVGDYMVEPGAFQVLVGEASDDLPLMATVTSDQGPTDTTAPTFELTGFTDGQTFGNAASIDWGFTIDDPTATVVATLDGAPIDLTVPLALWRLALGQHTLVVTATDPAGNATTATYTFVVRTSLSDLGSLVTNLEAAGVVDEFDARFLGAIVDRAEKAKGKGNASIAQLENFKRQAERRVDDADARAALVRSVDAVLRSMR